MSKEILPGKLSPSRSVRTESPGVMEKKKDNKKRRGGLLPFLLAVGLGAVALTSVTLLAPVAFYDKVDSSPGSIEDKSGGKGVGPAAVITGALAASSTATDGKGTVIENNGLTKSDEITIAGYSDSSYSTKLHCTIDNLPAYCSGDPVSFAGLPPGEHVFTKVESINDQIAVQYFGWDVLE